MYAGVLDHQTSFGNVVRPCYSCLLQSLNDKRPKVRIFINVFQLNTSVYESKSDSD